MSVKLKIGHCVQSEARSRVEKVSSWSVRITQLLTLCMVWCRALKFAFLCSCFEYFHLKCQSTIDHTSANATKLSFATPWLN